MATPLQVFFCLKLQNKKAAGGLPAA